MTESSGSTAECSKGSINQYTGCIITGIFHPAAGCAVEKAPPSPLLKSEVQFDLFLQVMSTWPVELFSEAWSDWKSMDDWNHLFTWQFQCWLRYKCCLWLYLTTIVHLNTLLSSSSSPRTNCIAACEVFLTPALKGKKVLHSHCTKIVTWSNFFFLEKKKKLSVNRENKEITKSF